MIDKLSYEDLEKRIHKLEQNELELKQVKEDLKNYQAKLKALSEASFEAIFFSDKGICIDQNLSAEKMFGYSHQEAIGRPGSDWIIPDDRDVVINNMLKNYLSPYQVEALRKDGSTFPCQVQAYSTKYQGKTIRVTSLRDLTEQKRAEEKDTEYQQEIESIFRSAPTGIGVVHDRIINKVNKRLEEITGYSQQELLGQSSRIFYPSEKDYKYIGQENNRQISINGTGTVETKWKRKDGKIIDVLLSSTPINLENWSQGVTFTVLDITERLHNEKALQESQNRLRDISLSMADWIWETDGESKFIYLSQSIKDVLGYAPEELIGKTPFDLMPEDESVRVKEIISKIISKSENIKDLENWNIDKEGHRLFMLTNGIPIRDNEGKILGYRGVNKDITTQRKLKIQLQQAQKMESIGTLAGGIAHDFNNILSSIIGFSELALDGVDEGSTVEDDLQEVLKAGMRAKDLVKQILTFARQSDETAKPIQVNYIAKEVLKFLKSSIPASIQITNKIYSDSLIMGSPTQIHQVLMNLCTNAAQSMEEKGGILEVSVKDTTIGRIAMIADLRPGEYIEIKIKDTGMGISPQHIHTIFEPYFTTKPVGEGTGMGLAVVHGIIENYGGQITVDSSIGKGTCFTIYLPITKKRKLHTLSEKEALPLGNETILFVDDEAPIAKMGSKLLKQLGYSVTTRTSSVEALELFRSKPHAFDLVVSDFTMPNMTGDKMAIEMINIRSDIPVVLCTGYSKNISEETAAEIGIKALVFKPIAKAELAKTIRNMLDEANNSE
jgi:PAS domain S-box-containing protein